MALFGTGMRQKTVDQLGVSQIRNLTRIVPNRLSVSGWGNLTIISFNTLMQAIKDFWDIEDLSFGMRP